MDFDLEKSLLGLEESEKGFETIEFEICVCVCVSWAKVETQNFEMLI